MESHGEQRRDPCSKHADRSGLGACKQGLVLDDFLGATQAMRRHFELPTPNFGIKQIEQYPAAGEAFEKIIQGTVDRHGTEICSIRHRLLSEISNDIYLAPVGFAAYSRCKISPKWIRQSLVRLLEKGLQTVAQLPNRDSKPDYSPRKLMLLVSHLRKVGGEANVLLQKKETLDRVRAYSAHESAADRTRLLGIAEEMRWSANTLSAVIAQTRLVKSPINGPNPQVNFALYIAGWLEASTGREQYAPLAATLIGAAFSAAGKEHPKWDDRLPVEMHLKRRRRERHALSLLVSPPNR